MIRLPNRLLTMALLGLVQLSAGAATHAEILAAYRKTAPKGVRLSGTAAFVLVLADRQLMFVDLGGGKTAAYRVSTAAAGIGAEANSDKTPPGWHRVCRRIGGKAKTGQLFRMRSVVPGAVLSESEWREPTGDKVLSRILWLEGLEPGVNRDPKGNYDSYLRHIYIHGTNQEQFIGTPASHGCIRMRNEDVVRLYDSIETFKDVYVLIVEKAPKGKKK